MTPFPDCCFRCAACDRAVCRDLHPSPLEADGICVDCALTEETA